MKKVLIICDAFPPHFAPRMGYLCKYIKESGWQAFVLSADFLPDYDRPQFTTSRFDKDFSFLTGSTEVERICVSHDEKQKYLETQKYSLAKKIKAFFLPDYNRPLGVNEKMFFKGVEILQKQHFDAILSSTYNLTPMDVAKKLSGKFNIPWIADLRDILEQSGKQDMPLRAWLVEQRIRLRRNYLLRKAAAVISVSPWHVDVLKKINSNVHLIYNGFDPEIFKFEQPRITPKFTMCYTGHIYINVYHDLSFFFTALSRLIVDKIINPERFQITFYSDNETKKVVMAQAKHYNIESLIDCKAYVSGTEVPDILHQSSILLLLSVKSTPSGGNGLMTTKFFEYLATGRPILLTRSDEAVLEQALLEAKAGVAARTVDDVYNFVKCKYHEWQKNGCTIGTTDELIISKYSRREQAKQFVSVFENIINEQNITQ